MNTLDSLLERISDEADLCRNDGAHDIADLLDDARIALEGMAELLGVARRLLSSMQDDA